jgi:hypothetical protein
MEFGGGIQLGGAFGISAGPGTLLGLAIVGALGLFLGAEAVAQVKESVKSCPCSNASETRPWVHSC